MLYQVFQGNSDNNGTVSHVLTPTFVARYVRVKPSTWHIRPCMRIELFGCKYASFSSPRSTPTSITQVTISTTQSYGENFEPSKLTRTLPLSSSMSSSTNGSKVKTITASRTFTKSTSTSEHTAKALTVTVITTQTNSKKLLRTTAVPVTTGIQSSSVFPATLGTTQAWGTNLTLKTTVSRVYSRTKQQGDYFSNTSHKIRVSADCLHRYWTDGKEWDYAYKRSHNWGDNWRHGYTRGSCQTHGDYYKQKKEYYQAINDTYCSVYECKRISRWHNLKANYLRAVNQYLFNTTKE